MRFCPLKPTEYVDRGFVERIGGDADENGIDVYRVGNSTRCIVWNYDIFGFDMGRTRQLADELAERGFMVIIPDFYRGTFIDPSKGGDVRGFIRDHTKLENLKRDWEKFICPYAMRLGARKFGVIGTCWGTYPVIRFSAYPEVTVGVSMHPSHPGIMRGLSENEEEAYEAIKNKSYQLFMPAGSDPDSVKTGGLASNILKKRAKVVEFPDMNHGWTTRGDLSQPDVERDVNKAMSEATKFFDKHL